MSTDGIISLQATIGGMAAEGGQVYTVLGALDIPTGTLLVYKASVVKPGTQERRFGDAAAVSNNPETQARDVLFTDTDIRDAIADYFEFSGRGLLKVEADAARFDPASQIEADGVDEHGRKYRIATGMTNGQMSVLAMCWLARRQRGVHHQINAFEDFEEEFGITSVGLDDGLNIGPDGWPRE